MSPGLLPLYREAATALAGVSPASSHGGLVFDKYADAWRRTEAGFEFGDEQGKRRWLSGLAGPWGIRAFLDEACIRQHSLVEAMGGTFLCFRNESRFVTGLGREHPVENGFVWHPTLGVPYLPGSTLKGILRAWCREQGDEGLEQKFGSQCGIGQWIVLDMLPRRPVQITVDVMTPHYTPYYRDGAAPGDWHSPTPIPFLAAEAGNSWQTGVLFHGRPSSEFQKEACQVLTEALLWLGAGAKTMVGYGRFIRSEEEEATVLKRAQERRERELESRRREEALAGKSEPLQALMRRAHEEGWERDNAAFLDGMEDHLEKVGTLPSDCVDWLRELIEKKWPGIWNNPDAVKGKKKKPAYKPRPINLVKRLKSM